MEAQWLVWLCARQTFRGETIHDLDQLQCATPSMHASLLVHHDNLYVCLRVDLCPTLPTCASGEFYGERCGVLEGVRGVVDCVCGTELSAPLWTKQSAIAQRSASTVHGQLAHVMFASLAELQPEIDVVDQNANQVVAESTAENGF